MKQTKLSSTPGVDNSGISLHCRTAIESNQPLTTQPESIRDKLIGAEERGGPLGNKSSSSSKNPPSKYANLSFPPIYYPHRTVFDRLDVNIAGDSESLSKGKILAQPFDPDARSISTNTHTSKASFSRPPTSCKLAISFMTAIMEITNLHGISVCAARAKVNLYRTAFLVPNLQHHRNTSTNPFRAAHMIPTRYRLQHLHY